MWFSGLTTAAVLSWFTCTRGQGTSQPPQMCGGGYSSATFHLPLGSAGRCDYVVDAASPSVCQLELDLGPHQLPACPSDLLTLDGRPVCGVHPGVVQLPFQQPRSTISTRGNLGGRNGLNITVRQIECRNRQTSSSWCGGEFSGENVVILSPGYPSGYPGGVDCKCTITASAPSVCQVEVRFEDSVLEKSANCSKDRLQINGDVLCGELRGVRTYYIDEKLDLRFTSDSEGEGKGFKLIARQIMCTDDTDPVVIEAAVENDKLDTVLDCFPQIPSVNPTPTLDEGYPVVQRPWPHFNLPERNNGRFPSVEYPPPDDSYNSIPYDQDPPVRQYPPISSSYGIPHRVIGSPQLSTSRPPLNVLPSSFYHPHPDMIIPVQERPSLNNFPYRPNYVDQPIPIPTPIFLPVRPSVSYDQQYQQCCGLSYSDSHFLIVSPGFPRSQSSSCIYTINKFSSLTNQLRLQFRYFWAGVDTGTGCSGGYLEIDGSRVCGCKTGLVWTSPFLDSETTKILRLRLDPFTDRLFDGFVIEVFQDDSYSQRYKRLGEATSAIYQDAGRSANFSQYIETVVERKPTILSDDYQILLSKPSEKLIWDPSRQTWWLPTDLLCLRWNLQDWYLLAREAAWALYHCPVSAVTGAGVDAVRGGDVTQSTACQTCRYFCRQNCRCC